MLSTQTRSATKDLLTLAWPVILARLGISVARAAGQGERRRHEQGQPRRALDLDRHHPSPDSFTLAKTDEQCGAQKAGSLSCS